MKRAKAKAKVILVGAGPGDPGLLTLRGWNALQKADVILYDHLVNPEILRWSRPDARRLFVGKEAGASKWNQQAIHKVLLAESRRSRVVVRLKGGDPYLFGRGAEEGIFLKKHRIPFEVIPGVTSAVGCAATAGIPLTERHLSSSVSFVTGHEAGDKARAIDWKGLSSTGTLAVYMGVSRIRDVTAKLIQSGVPRARPAAVVEWGTWNRQRTCVGTIADIARKVETAKIGAPAMLFVGDVVRLRAKLNWFENRPLFGRRIVVTRALSQSANLRRALEDEGAQVIEIPAIEILPPLDWAPMDAAIARLGSFDWIVFTSTNGVDYFFERLASKKGRDVRALAAARIAAVGSATEKQLRQYGIRADFVPSAFSTHDLFEELLRSRRLAGQHFLLLRSHIAPPGLALRLRKAGARVTEVAAYRTLSPHARIRDHFRRLGGPVDAVCFTSASTTDGFFGALSRRELKKGLGKARIVSIGPVTSAAVRRHGFRVHAEADPYTAEGLAEAVIRVAAKKKSR